MSFIFIQTLYLSYHSHSHRAFLEYKIGSIFFLVLVSIFDKKIVNERKRTKSSLVSDDDEVIIEGEKCDEEKSKWEVIVLAFRWDSRNDFLNSFSSWSLSSWYQQRSPLSTTQWKWWCISRERVGCVVCAYADESESLMG